MSLEQAKQPVSAALTGPYGHPFHPILVTVPIGAWVCSLVFDVGSRIVDDPAFLTRASEWLIAIGVLGAAAAALVGFLDFIVIPSGTPARRVGWFHLTLWSSGRGHHRSRAAHHPRSCWPGSTAELIHLQQHRQRGGTRGRY